MYLSRLSPLMSRNACNGENGEKSPASGDLDWMPKWPLGGWRFGENGDFGKNRQRAGDNGDKRPGPLETGDFGENGIAIVAKLAIFAKITRGLAISRMWDYIQIGCQK